MAENQTKVKADVSIVDIAGIKFEGLMSDHGEFGIGVPQICSLFQFLNKNAQRDIKALLGDDVQFLKWCSKINPKPVNVLSLSDAECLIHCLALKSKIMKITEYEADEILKSLLNVRSALKTS